MKSWANASSKSNWNTRKVPFRKVHHLEIKCLGPHEFLACLLTDFGIVACAPWIIHSAPGLHAVFFMLYQDNLYSELAYMQITKIFKAVRAARE
jgi:hypothetical protein